MAAPDKTRHNEGKTAGPEAGKGQLPTNRKSTESDQIHDRSGEDTGPKAAPDAPHKHKEPPTGKNEGP